MFPHQSNDENQTALITLKNSLFEKLNLRQAIDITEIQALIRLANYSRTKYTDLVYFTFQLLLKDYSFDLFVAIVDAYHINELSYLQKHNEKCIEVISTNMQSLKNFAASYLERLQTTEMSVNSLLIGELLISALKKFESKDDEFRKLFLELKQLYCDQLDKLLQKKLFSLIEYKAGDIQNDCTVLLTLCTPLLHLQTLLQIDPKHLLRAYATKALCMRLSDDLNYMDTLEDFIKFWLKHKEYTSTLDDPFFATILLPLLAIYLEINIFDINDKDPNTEMPLANPDSFNHFLNTLFPNKGEDYLLLHGQYSAAKDREKFIEQKHHSEIQKIFLLKVLLEKLRKNLIWRKQGFCAQKEIFSQIAMLVPEVIAALDKIFSKKCFDLTSTITAMLYHSMTTELVTIIEEFNVRAEKFFTFENKQSTTNASDEDYFRKLSPFTEKDISAEIVSILNKCLKQFYHPHAIFCEYGQASKTLRAVLADNIKKSLPPLLEPTRQSKKKIPKILALLARIQIQLLTNTQEKLINEKEALENKLTAAETTQESPTNQLKKNKELVAENTKLKDEVILLTTKTEEQTKQNKSLQKNNGELSKQIKTQEQKMNELTTTAEQFTVKEEQQKTEREQWQLEKTKLAEQVQRLTAESLTLHQQLVKMQDSSALSDVNAKLIDEYKEQLTKQEVRLAALQQQLSEQTQSSDKDKAALANQAATLTTHQKLLHESAFYKTQYNEKSAAFLKLQKDHQALCDLIYGPTQHTIPAASVSRPAPLRVPHPHESTFFHPAQSGISSVPIQIFMPPSQGASPTPGKSNNGKD